MQVNVSTKCPRCGKKTVMDVSLEDAVKLEESQKHEAGALATLEASVTAAMQECPVESFILVAVKNPDGTFAMKSLSGLCTGNRSCMSKVGTLVQEMFVPVKQVPKKKGSEAPAESKEDADDDANG
jgi:hypothetical protein